MVGLLNTDRSDFERAVRAHSADLFRFAYWLCRDRALAEELVQEAFHRAWRTWEGLREPSGVKSWLFTVVRNEHARVSARASAALATIDDPATESLPATEILNAPDARAALGALPESLREPLLLQLLGGFSCAEIGWLLETTEDAAMTRLTRARRTLRGALATRTVLRAERSGR
jgi:RNA polymerase sigma-70 factor (ECF subfamily)